MPNSSHAQPTDPQGPEPAFDFAQITRGVLRRRKKVVVGTFLLIALPLLWWSTYGQRPRFQSGGIIHLKPAITRMIPETQSLPVGHDLSVQITVLRSRSLAREVLETLPQETLDELMNDTLQPDYWRALTNSIRRLQGKPPAVASPRRKAISELRSARMDFQAMKRIGGRGQSGMVEMSATAYKPRVALDLVNAYIQVLVNWSRRSEEEDIAATEKFLELQLDRVRDELQGAEAAMSGFEQQHGVVTLTDHTKFDMARLLGVQGELSEILANEEVQKGWLKTLRAALKKSGAKVSEAQSKKEAARELIKRLAEMETILFNMRSKYTEKHPSMIAVREEIQSLRSQLAQFPIAAIGGPQTELESMSPDEVLREIATVQMELKGLRSRKKSLKLQIAQFQGSLRKLGDREFEYSRLSGAEATNRNLYRFLAEKIFALRIRKQTQGDVVKIIDPPNFPTSPIRPISVKKLIFLVFFALGTAGGLGFLVEHIYEPVESELAIRRQIDLPALGSAIALPSRQSKDQVRPLLVFNESQRPTLAQEFYRTIRTNLEAANLRRPSKALMIASPFPGEGKSTTAINLAMALRELGRRVVLVDSDLRQPSLSQLLRSETQGGLANILKTDDDADASVPVAVSMERMGIRPGSDFTFIPSGDPSDDPGALLCSTRARELVEWLRQGWDYVLLDAPPVLVVSDNILIATALDGVILVAKAGRTKKRDMQHAKRRLEDAGVRVLGVILNQVSPRQIPYYSAYKSYYGPREPHRGYSLGGGMYGEPTDGDKED